MAACNQRILIVQVEAVVFKIKHSRYTALGKGYVDAIAAHEVSILQYMQDYNTEYRILDEPLQVVRLGVAFGKNDVRGLETQLTATLDEMRADGTLAAIIGKYLANPEKFLEVDGLVVALRFKNTSTQSDTVSKIEQTLLMTQNFENLNESA